MYFIIREGWINAGPFDNLEQARGVPTSTENDMVVNATSGRVTFMFGAGGWVKVRRFTYLSGGILKAMQMRAVRHADENTLSRRNDTELQDAIDILARAGCQDVDMVNAPPHYNQAGIECIDAITAATSGKTGIEAVCVANVIKYLWRYELKNGVEDVKKARWYLDRLIGELEK